MVIKYSSSVVYNKRKGKERKGKGSKAKENLDESLKGGEWGIKDGEVNRDYVKSGV